MIQIEVEANEESDSDYEPSAFSWSVIDYKDRFMYVQLDWEDPFKVS